jgi:hypothetical protein
MKEFLKGNYKVDTEIKETVADERSQLETEFERKALSRLGGSICFVSKKSFIWNGDQPAEGEPSDRTSSRADTQQGEAQPKASRADTQQGEAQPKASRADTEIKGV